MAHVLHPRNEEEKMKNAPKKCLDFVFNYSKSYQVIQLKSGQKTEIILN